MAAGGRSGAGSLSLETMAAMAPAPLAAAPEQALKAEVSETASEPDRLFAPDFIISQVLSLLWHQLFQDNMYNQSHA